MKDYKYKITLKNRIDSSDDKILSYLYQPIIGLNSMALYKLLIHEAEINRDFKSVLLEEERLLKLCETTSEKLNKQIKKLEATGLIETLYNKQKNLACFNIYSPLDAKDFFQNRLFNNALLIKIGEKNYEIARYIFRDEGDPLTESGYENKSSKFLEVFSEFTEESNYLSFSKIKVKPRKSNVLLKGFNYENIIKEMKKNKIFISPTDVEKQRSIEDVYVAYNITISEIINTIKKIYNEEIMDFSLSDFYEEISKLYLAKNNSELFVPSDNIELQTNKKIKEMETIEPYDYLRLLFGDEKIISSNDETVIKTLLEKYKLRNGVINCLLEFSYYKNNKDIVGNYLFKIASTMNERNIKTADKAMEFLKVAHKKTPTKKSNEYLKNEDIIWQEAQTKKTYEINLDDKVENSIWGEV